MSDPKGRLLGGIESPVYTSRSNLFSTDRNVCATNPPPSFEGYLVGYIEEWIERE
jgi:hypothetical protein